MSTNSNQKFLPKKKKKQKKTKIIPSPSSSSSSLFHKFLQTHYKIANQQQASHLKTHRHKSFEKPVFFLSNVSYALWELPNSSTTSEARNTSLELSQICQSDASLFVSWFLLFFTFVSCELCNTIFSSWSLPLLSVFFVFSIRSFSIGYRFSLLVFEFCFGLSSYEWRKVKRANYQDFYFVNFEM